MADSGSQDDLDLDDDGILRAPDGSDFALDDDGILRPLPSTGGRDSGIESVTPNTSRHSDNSYRDDNRQLFSGFDENVGGDHVIGPPLNARSRKTRAEVSADWPTKPVGILKSGSQRAVTPPNGQLTQDLDYCGSVPNNTQECDTYSGNSQTTPGHSQTTPGQSQTTPGHSQTTPGHSQTTPAHSQSSGNDDEEAEIDQEELDYPLNNTYMKASSETQEDGDDSSNSTPHRDVLNDGDNYENAETAADITLSDDDVRPLDLDELQRYAELEINGHNYLSNEDLQKTPAPLPTIYLATQDHYMFSDESRDVDRSGSSLHLVDLDHDDNEAVAMEDEVPVFTGASIPFGESGEEVAGAADAGDRQQQQHQQHHADNAAAMRDDGFLTQHIDIPHSLIEFEALEVQLQIQSQLAQLKEEEDVFGDFLHSTEQSQRDKDDFDAGGRFSPGFHTGDSLPFDNTQESDDLRAGRPPAEKSGSSPADRSVGGSPSRIPLVRGRPLTKDGSLRSSTDSLSSTLATANKVTRKPPSPTRVTGRITPQKKDNKENRRPNESKYRQSSLNLKQPRSNTTTPQQITPKSSTSSPTRKGPKPVKASHTAVPNLDLNDSLDDSDVDRLKANLRGRLQNEQSKRQQQHEMIKQLQEDYDRLLTKFALAEVTIDQLRLGAKMNLYSESPVPQQQGQLQQSAPAQQLQHFNTATRGQGQMGVAGQGQSGRRGQVEFQGSRPHSRGSLAGLTPLSFHEYDEPAQFQDQLIGGTRGESIKLGLLFQARSLSDQMESFQMLLDEDELNTEEQENVIDKVKGDYDKLQLDYRQAKVDNHLMRQHNIIDVDEAGDQFDGDRVIEGELFRLGMKLDDLQQSVEENMRVAKRRTPFQDQPRPGSRVGGRSRDTGTTTGYRHQTTRPVDDSSTTDVEADMLDGKWQKLLKDYKSLLDLFDRMKQLPKSPQRDSDIAALMKKLQYLHKQSPKKLPPLPHMPDSDNDTDGGSLFGSAASVVRATAKGGSGVTSESSSLVRGGGTRRRHGSQSRADSVRDGSQRDDRRQHRRSQSSHVESEHGERPRAPHPSSTATVVNGPELLAPKKAPSDRDSTHSRTQKSQRSKPEPSNDHVTGHVTADGHATTDSHMTRQTGGDKKSVRPVELDRDSGFVGSESSRLSQTMPQKRGAGHNMSTVSDASSTHYSYKPAVIPTLITAPPQHSWTDSEPSPTRHQHMTPKPSMTSLNSDAASRSRQTTRASDVSHHRRETRSSRRDSESEALSTGRASVKSEKLRNLESEVEKLKEFIAQQQQQQVKQTPSAAPADVERQERQQPWQQQWLEQQRRHPDNDVPKSSYDNDRKEIYPQTWAEYPYHGLLVRRHSLADSDIPSIDTFEPDQSPYHKHSMPSSPDMTYQRHLDDKRRTKEEKEQLRGRAPSKSFDREPIKIAKPADLDRHRERQEMDNLLSRDRQSANRHYRSKSMPRRLSYDTDDSPTRGEEKRMREPSQGNFSLRKDAEQTYGRLKPRDRYLSLENIRAQNEADDTSRSRARDNVRQNGIDDALHIEPMTDHEKHYRFFRDLDKGREHIQKVLDKAVEKQRRQRELDQKTKKRNQPVIVTGPGTITKTATQRCPMCQGAGECTHTEVYHLAHNPHGVAPVGMMYSGTSPIAVDGDVATSVARSLNVPPVPVAQQTVIPQPAHYVIPTNYPVPGQFMAGAQSVPQPYTQIQQQVPVQSIPAQVYPQTDPARRYAGSAISDGRPDLDESPVIRIPLRLYETKRNVKYVVREFSSEAPPSLLTAEKHRHQSRSRHARSSSVPTRDSVRGTRSSGRYDADDNESEISSRRSLKMKESLFDKSLEDAVRLAAELQKISGKIRDGVKHDLRKSVRNEHLWATT